MTEASDHGRASPGSRSSGGDGSTICWPGQLASALRRTSSTVTQQSYAFGNRAIAYTCSASVAAPIRCAAWPAGLRWARRLASEAVKRVYQYGSSIKGDPQRAERERRAIRFRSKYFAGDSKMSNTAPYFLGAWDT